MEKGTKLKCIEENSSSYLNNGEIYEFHHTVGQYFHVKVKRVKLMVVIMREDLKK